MTTPAKNTICLWYDRDAEAAARFYAKTFPDSSVTAVHRAPGDFPSGKQGDVLTVDFTVLGIPCMGLNGGPMFKHTEAFSFQVATVDQAETDRYWNAIVGNGGQESACGWCKDKWGLSLADHADRAHEGDHRSRSRRRQARVRRDDADAQDRHRDDRGGAAGLSVSRSKTALMKRAVLAGALVAFAACRNAGVSNEPPPGAASARACRRDSPTPPSGA